MPPLVDEVFDVVYVDGIWVARDVVVLIACTDEHGEKPSYHAGAHLL